MVGIKPEVGRAGPPPERVAGLVLQQQHGAGCVGIVEQALLERALGLQPGWIRNGVPAFKKDCIEVGSHAQAFLAWKYPEPREAVGVR
jgi:hypothetical protein